MRSRNRTILIVTVATLAIIAGVWVGLRRHIIGIGVRPQERSPTIRDFQALPYLSHVEDDAYPDLKGVTLHNEALSYAGVNLLTSLEVGGAHLLDMDGNVLHSWVASDSIGDRWLYSEMDRQGNLICLVIGTGLVKMDWDSQVLWVSRASDNPYLKGDRPGYHHDFEMTESGDLYVLAHELRQGDIDGRERPRKFAKRGRLTPGQEIRDNCLITLSPEGIAKGSVSFYDLVGEVMAPQIRKYAAESERRFREQGKIVICSDIFHSNTAEEIRRDIGIGKKGDVLFCIRNLDFIGILDVATEHLIWSWGPGVLEYPHYPTVVEDGNILVFDNGRRQRGYSKVIELDPRTNEIVWQYEGEPRESFFAAVMGASQRLPNGNTLITESTKGRVFEVTQDGEIVWQFLNFEVGKTGNAKGKRATIYRMIRYGHDYLNRRSDDDGT